MEISRPEEENIIKDVRNLILNKLKNKQMMLQLKI